MKKLVKNEWFKIPGADNLDFYILQNANKKFTLLVSAEGEKLDKLVSLDEIIKDQTGLDADIANTTLSAISTFVKQYEKKLESRNQPETDETGVITLDRDNDVVEDQLEKAEKPEEKVITSIPAILKTYAGFDEKSAEYPFFKAISVVLANNKPEEKIIGIPMFDLATCSKVKTVKFNCDLSGLFKPGMMPEIVSFRKSIFCGVLIEHINIWYSEKS